MPLLYLSAYFERQRDAYYDRLLAVSERGAWNEWLEFFLQGVADQSRDAIARARQIQDLQTQWREQLTQTRSSALLLRLVDYLFESPFISVAQAQRQLNIAYNSASTQYSGNIFEPLMNWKAALNALRRVTVGHADPIVAQHQ